jgi:hypothetical protein
MDDSSAQTASRRRQLLPDYIDPEAWGGYCETRKAMGQRAPFTEYAKKLTLRKLEEFHRQGYDVNHILESAVERGWRGVFLTNDTPRRTLTQGEKQNVQKIAQLVGRIGK